MAVDDDNVSNDVMACKESSHIALAFSHNRIADTCVICAHARRERRLARVSDRTRASVVVGTCDRLLGTLILGSHPYVGRANNNTLLLSMWIQASPALP